MKNNLIKILVIVLAVILLLGFTKDIIVKVSVEHGVQLVTGLKLSIKNFNIGLIKTLVGIKDLKLYNPPGFEDKVMLDMPEIYVDYNLPAIFKGKVHLEEVRIDLKEFVVVKNEKGELNLDSIKVVKEQKEAKEEKPAEEEKPKEKGKAPEIQIDTLTLKVGKVIYKDYSKGAEPEVQEFNIALDEKFEDIDNPNAVVSLIIVKALMNTTVGRLTGFDVKGLENTIGDTLASAQEVTAQAQETAVHVTKQAAEAAKQTTEAAQKTADELKDTFKKLPFGSGK